MLIGFLRHRRRIARDRRIADLRAALARAQEELHEDELTRLLNRRGFRRACDRHPVPGAAPATVLTCAMIDLDGLKQINDNYGHAAGDAALSHFATVLGQTLRPSDTVARLGGDEFAVLIPGVHAGLLLCILDRMRTVLQATPLQLDASTLTLAFSAGVAQRRQEESMVDTLSRADIALLEAKCKGKDMTLCDCELLGRHSGAYRLQLS